MEINKMNVINNINSVVGSYNRVTKTTNPTVNSEAGAKIGTFDTVEIDFTQLLEQAKADVANKLVAELAMPNTANIQTLQSAYADDVVPVDTSVIVDAILGE